MRKFSLIANDRVTVARNPSWLHEIKGLFICLYTDPLVLLLFPFFLGSNWFYTYQQSDYNLALFDTRTRSLNAMLYYGAQIFGAGSKQFIHSPSKNEIIMLEIVFGYFLDYKGLGRKSRAWLGWAILFVVIVVNNLIFIVTFQPLNIDSSYR
jgi:hypothetical protein